MKQNERKKIRTPINSYQVIQIFIGIAFISFLSFRLYSVISEGFYGADTWVRFFLSGLIIGSVYSVIAIGYTLVYGILFMINFAHGEIMMLGAFGGYFVFEILNSISIDPVASTYFLDTYPIISILLAFIIGMTVASLSGFFIEKIAYRPLRGAPRFNPIN